MSGTGNFPIPPGADNARPAFLIDPSNGAAVGATGPFANIAAITPSDSVNLPFTSRGLWIGGGGSVSVVTLGGQTVTFAAVPAGFVLPVQVQRVNATGTTATN